MKPNKDSDRPAQNAKKKPDSKRTAPPIPRKKRSWAFRVFRAFFIFAFLMVLLGVGAGIVLQYYFPGETLRPIAEEKLTALLKMPVKIGKIEFNIFQGVKISKVSLGGAEKFFSVDDLTLNYDLSQLIQGKLTINRVIVKNPELNLISKNGVWNFQPLLGAAEKQPPPAPDAEPEEIKFFLPFAVDLKQFVISNISLSAQIDDQMLAHVEGLTVSASGKAGLSDVHADVHVVMSRPENSASPYNVSFLSREGEGINVRTLLLIDLTLSVDSIQSGGMKGTIGLKNSFVNIGKTLPSPDVNIQIEAKADLGQQTASLQKFLVKIAEHNEIDFTAQAANILGDPGFNFQVRQVSLDFEELLAIAGDLAPPLKAKGVLKVSGLEGSGHLKDNQLEHLEIGKGEIVLENFSASYPEMDAKAEGVSARINLRGIKVDNLVPQQVKASVEFQARKASFGDIAIRQLDQKLDIEAEGPNLLHAKVGFSADLKRASFSHPDLGALQTPVSLSGSAVGNFAAGDIKNFQLNYGLGKLASGKVLGVLKGFGKKGFSLNYVLNVDLKEARKFIPAKLAEETGLEQLTGKVHVDTQLGGILDETFMPVHIQGDTNIKLDGVDAILKTPALTLKGFNLEASVPAQFDSKKGIKIPALKIQVAIQELQALDNYSVGAVSVNADLSLDKFVSLKEPYGELPVKLNIKVQVESISAQEPKISLASLKVGMSANSDISSAKDARNVSLNGKVSLGSVAAMDMATAEEIIVDFKVAVNDLSLTKTSADVSVSVKSPFFKNGDMEVGFKEFEFKSVSRHNLKEGTIDIDSAVIRLPSIIGLTVKGHLDNWGEKFSIVSEVPPFRLNAVLAKLPTAIRNKLEGLEMDGIISFNLKADGKIPDEKAIRKMDIPVTLNSKFKLANFNISWPEQNIRVENLNILKQINLKDNTANLSGNISIGKVTYGDFFGEEGLKPEWDFHFTLENWDKLTIKKHHLSFANKGFSEKITGRVEGLKGFLSGKRPLQLSELLRRLEVSVSAKNSIEIDKALSMVKGLEAKGNFAAQMDFNLSPGKKVEAGGSLEFKNFNAQYEKTVSINGIDGKLIFSKRLFLDRKLLAAQPKAFSVASKGFFNQLRDFSQYKNIFQIKSAEFDSHKASNIGVDVYFKNDRLVVEKFLMDVLGGSVAGSMFLIQTKEGPSLKFFTEFAGLDFNKLIGKKMEGKAEEAEVDGSLQFEFQINRDKEGERISLDQIKLKIFITRIGEETLDRILLFLDPEESKPAIVDMRSKLKLASPHKVIISLENGNLNVQAWLKVKALGVGVIEAPELKRVPVTSLKPFKDAVEQIQMLSKFQQVLNYLAAQGIEFDEDGKLVLF